MIVQIDRLFFVSIVLLLISSTLTMAQPSGHGAVQTDSASSKDTDNLDRFATRTKIPFKLTAANNIAVEAVVNTVYPVQLMFHTGNENVCLTKNAVAKMPELNFDNSGTAKSWGGESNIRFSSGNSIRIGKNRWNDILIFEDQHSGPGTDGKFGPDLFKGKVIEIDFDLSEMIIHNSLPNLGPAYQRLDYVVKRNCMLIKCELEIEGEWHANEFMIHTGFGGTALLDDQFVSDSKIGEDLVPIATGELRDSMGNVLKTATVKLPLFKIGNTTLKDIPIALFDGAIGRQKISVLGGEILKRFNILIDLRNSQLYLRPNSRFASAYPK